MSLQANVYFIVSFYCLCSACMLIVNKLAVHHIGVPAAVTISQFFATASFVGVSECAGLLQTDGFEWAKLKYFVVYVMAFSAGTWSNMTVLMVSNVETVIVFRSCAPFVVCIFDYLFHNRALPSARSAFAMCLIVGGAAMYVLHDHTLSTAGGAGAYFWVGVWFSLLVFQLTYGKYLVSGLGLKSVWSPVLYTNLLSLVPTLAIGLISGEYHKLLHVELTTAGVTWLLVSCVVGTGISWAGVSCQTVLSATAYTVVGVMNKMLTEILNVLIWDKHASPLGIFALAVCVGGGALYQQAPLRSSGKTHAPREVELKGISGGKASPAAPTLASSPHHRATTATGPGDTRALLSGDSADEDAV